LYVATTPFYPTVAFVVFAISRQLKAFHKTIDFTHIDDNYETSSHPPGARQWNTQQQQQTPPKDNLRGGDSSNNNKATDDIESLNTLNIKQRSQTSSTRRSPRIIVFGYSYTKDVDSSTKLYPNDYWLAMRMATDVYTNTKVMPLNQKKLLYSKDFEYNSMPSEQPQITQDWYSLNAEEFIDGYSSNCEPMYDWQLKSYPACNNVHELDLMKMKVINTGGSRIAFEMKQQLDNIETKFVYKTTKYHRGITTKAVEEQRRDSLVLGKTSSSQFIPDIHGYCSLGVMMDYMPAGNMHDYIKGVRLAGGSTLPPVDRLRLSIHIATSVADLHTIDNTSKPSLFHNDLCCHQYLFQNGVFKLNDFNYARPIYQDKETKDQCTRSGFGMAMWKARSLEEHQIHLDKSQFTPPYPDKVDVWMMGNLMYYTLTDLYTFEEPENLSWKDSGRELIAGRRSPYPEHIENSKDPSHIAVKKALDMTWTQDWKKRPTARSVSDFLLAQLKEITGEEKPDLRVVLPERDPNQRSTESDYDEHND